MADQPAMREWAGELFERARAEGVELTGDSGLLTAPVRQVLQTGLQSAHRGSRREDRERETTAKKFGREQQIFALTKPSANHRHEPQERNHADRTIRAIPHSFSSGLRTTANREELRAATESTRVRRRPQGWCSRCRRATQISREVT